VLGGAVDLTVDAAGRMLIPAELRTLCGLNREVALLGLGEHFELWDAGRLAEREKAALEAGLAEQAADFQF
jgi:MraZ protein